MRRLLPLALVLAGCASAAPPDPRPTDSGAAGPSQSDPQATKPSPAPTVAMKGNPNRLHQLEDLKRTDLDVKGSPIHAWIMDDDDKQQEGMMFLKDEDVKADEGMLFAFDEPQPKTLANGDPRGFWMRNTLIPLDIVYLTSKGQVLNVGQGKVKDETTIPAQGDFRYVLELKAGTAARLGLKPGDTIAIPKL